MVLIACTRGEKLALEVWRMRMTYGGCRWHEAHRDMTTHVSNEVWDCAKASTAKRLESEFDKLDGKPEECIRVLQEGV
jgi:hypothetical protein